MKNKIIKKDIEFCKSIDVDGVVIGFLNPDGSVDKETTTEMAKLASPMSVTFHRAFDMSADPEKSLEDIIRLWC